MNFEKLTPNNNIDISVYKKALDFALDTDRDITNIAVTGPYSSGKSSVVETYEKESNLSYLHISLSHYDKSEEIDTKDIEGKIVNQLLYQIESKKIPKTVFKAKGVESVSERLKQVGLSFMIVFWFIFMYLLVKRPDFSSNIWVIVMFGVLSAFLLDKLISAQINKKVFKSISLGGNKVEILGESENSYFDKFMNDVIYLFINSGADAIVFEDLDRFDDPTIYEKLQEINILVNRSLKKERSKSRKIAFIYLLRDDTLLAKDRTKFFDFIIPVVPVMDGSNSYEKFLDVFKSNGLEKEFSDSTLRKVALYIDDFRLLKNIVNEYIMYKGNLYAAIETENYLNSNKMLGMMIYKNIFPKDFSLLQYGKSFINYVFLSKEELIKKKSDEIQKGIEHTRNKIKDIEAEQLESIDELNAIFIKDSTNIKVDGKGERNFTSRLEFVRAIREAGYNVTKEYTFTGSSKYNILTELEESDEYKRRRELVKAKQENMVSDLEGTIEYAEKTLADLKYMSLSELLRRQDEDFWQNIIEENKNFEYLQNSEYFKLVKILLLEEIIDEKYRDYITYFYEGNLKVPDKKFTRAVFDRESIAEDYDIEDPQKVLDIITVRDVKIYHVFNIDLFMYVISKEYVEYIDAMLDNVISIQNYNFLIVLINKIFTDNSAEREQMLGTIFDELNREHPDALQSLINSPNISDKNKGNCIFRTICFSTMNMEKKKGLISFIENVPVRELDTDLLVEKINNFKKLGIKFNNILNISKDIIVKIVKEGIFELNTINVATILEINGIDVDSNEYRTRNYSLISEKLSDDSVREALLGNNTIDKYMNIYLGLSDGKIEDDEAYVIEILNNQQIATKTKEQYINRLSAQKKLTKIIDINDKSLWEKLLEGKNISGNLQNLVQILGENDWKLDTLSIEYINSFENIVDADELSDDDRSKLFDVIIVNNEICEEKYTEILKVLNLHYPAEIWRETPEDRIPLLVKEKIIPFSKENLADIRSRYNNCIDVFVYYNFEKYMEIIKEQQENIDDELIELLQSQKFNFKQEKEIISNLEESHTIQEENYSDSVAAEILKKAYDENDFEYLVENYENLGKLVQGVAYNIISQERNINKVINSNAKIPQKLLNELLDSEAIDIENRQQLFVNNLESLSVKEIDRKIKKLELPIEFSKVLRRGRPKVPLTEFNWQIAKQFQKMGWITKLEEKDDTVYMSGRQILK